ncbi:MAG: hypothetical protein K2X87_14490 [Gemmataceae bacterium]|nr:hypothetical protein [Gemmataceae bacterium]
MVTLAVGHPTTFADADRARHKVRRHETDGSDCKQDYCTKAKGELSRALYRP